MRYPGLGIIGCEKLAGMYGVNEGIIDGKGTGVRHLFYDGFDLDLVHSAVTLIKDGDTIYYGNRVEKKTGHPIHLKPVESKTEEGFCFTDHFETTELSKIDRGFGFGESCLGFQCEIKDERDQEREIEVYAYVLLRPQPRMMAAKRASQVIAVGEHSAIGISAENCDLVTLVEEGPTGFIYRLTSALLYEEGNDASIEPRDDSLTGILLGKRMTLPANGSVSFEWKMQFERTEQELEVVLDACDDLKTQARMYWDTFVRQGNILKDPKHQAQERVNRIAIKSAMIGGFVPADLTGHYYSDGMPSYYARDSMMVARAFLLAGHYREAKEILIYLINRKKKVSGEFYQRYNGEGNPSEGANNNVFHQLDSIGYFARNLREYQRMTGERLMEESDLKGLMHALLTCEKKQGMVGPEGGVNEGVFGPAFITSSNMFIYGGVQAAMEMIEDDAYNESLKNLNKEILKGVESTYLAGEGYQYGYVSYHDDLVKKYDTPQYFGLLYGFEDTENMRATHQNLLQHAAFFEDGIGYSEQEYHHGPWIFNTGACAQYAHLIGDLETYARKLAWISDHGNAYGLMPEAVSGDDETQCYINPLIWACAEYVSTCHIKRIEEKQDGKIGNQ
jgi:hypothetical protein